MNTPSHAEEEDKGIIGRVYEDGRPVIYSFDNEMPPAAIRGRLQWLAVIAWKYQGAGETGMPQPEENERMASLEDAIENHIADDEVLRRAYSRTGNELKELVYYVHDQNQFLEAFNRALAGHPRYPIDISFYPDAEWENFQSLLNDFAKAPDSSAPD